MSDEVESGDFGGAFDSYTGGSDSDSGGSDSSDSSSSSSGGGSSSSGSGSDDSQPVQEGDFGGAFDDYVDNRDDSGSDDSGGSDSGPSGGSDATPEPTQSQEQMLDGSSGGGSSSDGDNPFGGDSGPSTPDAPSTDTDNPFDDSGSSGSSSSGGSSGGSSGSDSDDPPVGNTPSSGNLPSQSGSSPDSGQGIGPGGVSGSEEATPDSETQPTTDRDATENIDASRTARLESDATGSDRVTEQAQSLEQQVVGEQVTDLSTGLTATGAELREEDVEVVRDGDTLEAQLSPVGEERIENIADRQQVEQAERQIESELNTSFTDADVTVDNSGNVGVSENVENEATEQQIAADNPGVSESDISFQDGEPVVDNNESQQTPTERVEERTGLDEGEDFRLEDGELNVTERGAQELRGRQEQEEGDALTPVVEDFESVTGVDLPGDTSEAGQAREQAANNPSGELFGGRGEVEERLREASEGFDESVTQPAAEVAAEIGGIGPQDSGPNAETTRGLAQSGVGLFNAPQYAVSAIEAGEVAREGVSQTAVAGGSEEGFEQFEQDVAGGAARAGADVATAAGESPDQFLGQLVGGTAGATGALRAGRAVGGQRGANIAGAVVEPGETAIRGLRGTGSSGGSGGSDAPLDPQRSTGSGGVGSLLDPDELDAGRGPSRTARARGRIERSDTVQNIQNQLDEFFSDTSGQLRQTNRPNSGSSGSQSEPAAPRDFDPSRSEVLGGSPRDQLSSDIAERSRNQRQQNQGTFDGNEGRGPGQTQPRAENRRPGRERRRERSQRSEVEQDARRPDSRGRFRSEIAGLGVGVGSLFGDTVGDEVGVGQEFETSQDIGVGQGVGVDSAGRLDIRVDQDIGARLDQESRLDTRTETRVDTRADTRADVRTDSETDTPLRDLELPDDDDREQGGLGLGLSGSAADSQSRPDDGAATDFVAETLTGFGEGGLDVEATRAADDGAGFLSTQAQAEGSEGFEAAEELFSFGGRE